jgi:hypothetical protein
VTPAPPPTPVLYLAVAYPELQDQVMHYLVPQVVIDQARLREDEDRVDTEVHIRYAYNMKPVPAEVLAARTWIQRAKDLVTDAWDRICQDLFTDAHGKTVQRTRPMQPPPQQVPEPVHEAPVPFDPFEDLPRPQVLKLQKNFYEDQAPRSKQPELPAPVPKDKRKERDL